jgi:hypothetical protein
MLAVRKITTHVVTMSKLEESEQTPILPTINITKPEMAERQLNAAIRHYFLDPDSVPCLTLAGAAYQIVHDLAGNDHRGVVLDSGDEIGEGFYPAFRYPYMSLKHADRNPDEVLAFPVDLPELYIYEAIEKYYFLVGKYSLEMAVFLIWYNTILNRDDLYPEEPLRSKVAAFAQKFSKNDRAGFFEELIRPGILPEIAVLNKLLHISFERWCRPVV